VAVTESVEEFEVELAKFMAWKNEYAKRLANFSLKSLLKSEIRATRSKC